MKKNALIALSGPNTRIGGLSFLSRPIKAYPSLRFGRSRSGNLSLQDVSPDDEVEFEIYLRANRMIAPIGDKIQGVRRSLCARSSLYHARIDLLTSLSLSS